MKWLLLILVLVIIVIGLALWRRAQAASTDRITAEPGTPLSVPPPISPAAGIPPIVDPLTAAPLPDEARPTTSAGDSAPSPVPVSDPDDGRTRREADPPPATGQDR
jgi:hypothetical protein